MVITTTEQRQRYLRARVALALYRAHGHVPKEAEIDRVYQVTRVLFHDLLDARHARMKQRWGGQLVLF